MLTGARMRKADGTLSKTMVWNAVVITLTSVFGVAVAFLPELHDIVPPEAYVLIAILVKGVDTALRQITTQPTEAYVEKQMAKEIEDIRFL